MMLLGVSACGVYSYCGSAKYIPLTDSDKELIASYKLSKPAGDGIIYADETWNAKCR